MTTTFWDVYCTHVSYKFKVLLQADGFVDESHRRDESEDENWSRIAQAITLSPDQINNLANLRHAMQTKWDSILSTNFIRKMSRRMIKIHSHAAFHMTIVSLTVLSLSGLISSNRRGKDSRLQRANHPNIIMAYPNLQLRLPVESDHNVMNGSVRARANTT